MSKRALDDDQVREARRMHWLDGETFATIAAHFGVSLYTAHAAVWGDAAYADVTSDPSVAQILRHARKIASGRQPAA